MAVKPQDTVHTTPVRTLAAAFIFTLALAAIARAQVNVTVDATTAVRTVDDRMFGINTPFWDGTFTDAQSLDALTQMDSRFLRFGGGSATDQYNWRTNKDIVSGKTWAFNIDQFAVQAKAIHAQVVVTTNYGSGTAQDAADYVTYANVTKGYGFKYWEVGNECYGTWEYDIQANAHDPYTYATRAVQYIQAMKAVDPTIKIGVVAVTGEDASANGYSAHPAKNLTTGTSHNGWTPVMLATMKALGVLPDYLIYHRYDGAPGSENDSVLLQMALTWPSDAANLRQMLTDYLGSSGAGVELVVTENNSVYGSPGKQSTSLVNGLYLADSTANIMQTEFNGLMWWDFHNGQDTKQNNSASLYGWRLYGDYGIESGAHDHYPVYYIAKLLSHFARGGDTVVKASTNANLLSAYAVKRQDGSLTILAINKSATVSSTVNVTIKGFTPQATAKVYTYGIPQDTAAQTGTGSPDVAVSTFTSAGATFTGTVGPYTATVIALTVPSNAPTPSAQPVSQTIASGRTVVFGFPATGAPTPTFQWYLNGAAVAGATSSTLAINGATAANAGAYTCTATNASGAVTSSPATLTVVTTSDPGRLVNLSARAQVGTGANIIFAGFAIGGQGTSGSQSVLVRASGPALIPLGVTGTLPDPQLQLFDSTGTAIPGDLNNGWGGTAQIKATASAVGAFSWNSNTSHDSALNLALPSGPYTAQVSGQSGDSGDALVEVYDATPNGTYTASTPRLVNLSARVNVGSGAANALFAGFVIRGSTSVTVLIRASGPALIPLGVTGTLADPQLQLQNQGNGSLIASNTAWGGDAKIASTAASVGAFRWSNVASADSALLITLPPGNYNAVASGASGDAGVAIVEVYEVQ